MSDVRAFGAVGDGIHDDTEAIRHAVDQGDGYLIFDRGNYLISETIEIHLDTHGPIGITGSGGTAQITMTGEGPAFRLIGTHKKPAHPDGILDIVWKSERLPTVEAIAITGTHEKSDGIELIGTFQATLSRVHVRQCRHAIRIHEHNRNVLITDCHLFHNRGIGIFVDQCNLHQINVIGNHISYNRLGGIRIEGSQVYNLQITGNDIEYNNGNTHGTDPEPTAEIYIDTTGSYAIVNEVTIASNTIQATISKGGCNIRILDDDTNPELRVPGLYAITGNVIGSQEINLHLTGCHGITISGNSIYSCDQHNVLIESSDQINFSDNIMRRHRDDFRTGVRWVDCKNSIINSCIVVDEHPVGQTTQFPTMEIIRCQRITIGNCQLLSGTPVCLDVSASSYININGCTLADVRDEPTTTAALRFKGKGTGNLVSSCIIGPIAGNNEPLAIDEASNVTLSNNHIVAGTR